MATPARFDSSNSLRSPLSSLVDRFEDTDLDKRVQNIITTSSLPFSSSSSSSSSSSLDFLAFDVPSEFFPDLSPHQAEDSARRQKKRKRKEEGDLEKNISMVLALENEVHDYDAQIELLKVKRQQKIKEHNQASVRLHQRAVQQGISLRPRHILSPEDRLSLTTRQVFNNYLIELGHLNSRSFVTSLGNQA